MTSLPPVFSTLLGRHGGLVGDMACVIGRIHAERRSFSTGQTIMRGGNAPPFCCVIESGMAMRCHRAHGRTTGRVISGLHLPGDLIEAHGALQSRIGHDIIACGPTTVAMIEHAHLRALSTEHPPLTRLLMSMTAREAAISRRWLLVAGALRGGVGRLAHLLAEIRFRLDDAGVLRGDSYELPLLQRDLGDALGYSPVHVNRAARELRESGLIEWQGFHIRLPDPAALNRVARFDPAYLRLQALLS
ncbi:MAG: Crp/Fnr family transcriptional regulator [Paracoccus sp. (in: a-proteobacteria)]|nr:Crp/Fnr family transcriptional regulator [Paracoccus sp. (in: a-proteobacteria)]